MHTNTHTVSVFSEALWSGCIYNTAVSDVTLMNKTFLLLITVQIILQIRVPTTLQNSFSPTSRQNE